MNAEETISLWAGRTVLLAGGLALAAFVVYLCCDFAYRNFYYSTEFILWAVQYRRSRKGGGG